MKLSRCFIVLILLASLAGTQQALAEGWSLSKLNPFSKKRGKKPASRKVIRPESYRPSYILGTPTAYQQMKNNVEKIVSKTKNFFTFKKKTRPGPNPWHDPKYNPLAQPQEKKSSWWPWPKKEQYKWPSTPGEFIGLDRPRSK